MEYVQVHLADGIAEITLNRPKVNAMNRQLLCEIAAAFDQAQRDPAVRGALLLGKGSCLSAGLDLMEVASLGPETMPHFLDELDRAFAGAFRFDKPLAVAVHGHAIAGGLVIALCGDFMALARGDYKVGLTELAVGVPFPRVAFEIVRHGLPERALRRLVFEAGTYPPAEIFDMGCGDVLVDDPVQAARSWLSTVMSRSLETFAFVKAQHREQALDRMAAQSLAERQALEERLQQRRS